MSFAIFALNAPILLLELPVYSIVGWPKSMCYFVNETELKLYDIFTFGVGNPKNV